MSGLGGLILYAELRATSCELRAASKLDASQLVARSSKRVYSALRIGGWLA
jgi:hypothetical protein